MHKCTSSANFLYIHAAVERNLIPQECVTQAETFEYYLANFFKLFFCMKFHKWFRIHICFRLEVSACVFYAFLRCQIENFTFCLANFCQMCFFAWNSTSDFAYIFALGLKFLPVSRIPEVSNSFLRPRDCTKNLLMMYIYACKPLLNFRKSNP